MGGGEKRRRPRGDRYTVLAVASSRLFATAQRCLSLILFLSLSLFVCVCVCVCVSDCVSSLFPPLSSSLSPLSVLAASFAHRTLPLLSSGAPTCIASVCCSASVLSRSSSFDRRSAEAFASMASLCFSQCVNESAGDGLTAAARSLHRVLF